MLNDAERAALAEIERHLRADGSSQVTRYAAAHDCRRRRRTVVRALHGALAVVAGLLALLMMDFDRPGLAAFFLVVSAVLTSLGRLRGRLPK